MASDDASQKLLSIAVPAPDLLDALRSEIRLSDQILSRVVGRSAQTVRRWRGLGREADIPDSSAVAVEDLRTIAAMLLRAGFDGTTVKSFLLSRNVGLGHDRPLDGIRAGLDSFRRVEHVTECFIAGIAPEPGPALAEPDGEEFEPALTESPPPPTRLPPVGTSR